MIQIIRL